MPNPRATLVFTDIYGRRRRKRLRVVEKFDPRGDPYYDAAATVPEMAPGSECRVEWAER